MNKREPLWPIGEPHPVTPPVYDRRHFLKLLLGAGIYTVASSSGVILLDILPVLFSDRDLTVADRQTLLNLIDPGRVRLGLYPDYEQLGLEAIREMYVYQESQLPLQNIGVFALLENILTPAVMDVHAQRIRQIHAYDLTPLVSLGAGGYLTPHPFTPEHRSTLREMIRAWVEFLKPLATAKIRVRIFFEVNIFGGMISYGNNGILTERAHQAAFKELVEWFCTCIRREGLTGLVDTEICFAAAGSAVEPYFPQAPIKVVGIDIYPEPYGRLAVATLYSHLLGTQLTLLQNTTLVDVVTRVRPHFGEDTISVIHEIGAPDANLAFFEAAILLSAAALQQYHNEAELHIFAIDKTRQENMDYRTTRASLEVLRRITAPR